MNHMAPWLEYSPDGILMNKCIVEIKSPKVGKTRTAADVAKELPSLTNINRLMVLKEKHKFYCQIQLGMFLSNLKLCDFIIYCSFDSSIYIL